jgi:hypothetical protein
MRGFGRATLATSVAVVGIGVLGTLYQRGWGRVPFSVPSRPWYHAVPFYLFPAPRLSPWTAAGLLLAVLVVAAAVRLHRSAVAWPVRVAASAGLLVVLALAVAAMADGPASWRAPFEDPGEYPHGVGLVGPGFLRDFPGILPGLPFHATGHPAGATLLYALFARAWPGLDGAALLTVLVAGLGAIGVAALARDQLGEAGGRLVLLLWVCSPVVVLYTATSADAVFAVVLTGAALAADRGLHRRSVAWTVAGGALLWLGSMLTYSAVLLLAFLAVRAAGAAQERGWVVRWAALTAAVVLGLAGTLWAVTGYDVVATLRAVHAAYSAAPGSAGRPYLLWLFGDPVAFAAMLGLPLLAALAVRTAAIVRARAWLSFDAAALACLLAGSAWGFSKGEVERIFLFMAPLLLVPVVRQLTTWRVRPGVVAALLLTQTVLVQVLFYTRW